MMKFLKTSFFSAIATFIKLVSSFVINKAVAVYAGPAGLALFGHFQSFTTVVQAFANGGITSGIVKYSAEMKDENELNKVFSSCFWISVVSSFIITIMLFVLAPYLSLLLLKSDEYVSVFRFLAASLPLFSIHRLFLSILNGKQDMKIFIGLNIVASSFALVLALLLVTLFKVWGAMVALACSHSIMVFLTLWVVRKRVWFKLNRFISFCSAEYVKKLLKFALMALTSAIVVPVAQMLVRDSIIENRSTIEAGYWQGVVQITDIYLLMITISLSVYYLPKLAAAKHKHEVRSEVLGVLKLTLPLVAVGAIGIFLCRSLIVTILFSDEFQPMCRLFSIQLVATVVKYCGWLFGYLMLAKAMTKAYMFSEAFFSCLFLCGSLYLQQFWGIQGVLVANLISCTLYLFFVVFLFRKTFFIKRTQ